jgi:hypothetical protein
MVVPAWSQPSDGPGAGTGIPFDTTGLPDVDQMAVRFAALSDEERAEFAPIAEALQQLSGGRVELDFAAVTYPQPQDDAGNRPETIPPCVTVVSVKPEAGGWNPPAVPLVGGEPYLPLAAFRLTAHARVLSQISIGQRLAHMLAPDVYVVAVRPERLGSGFELFRIKPKADEEEGEAPVLEPVVGGIWIRSVRVVSLGKPLGRDQAIVVLDRWVSPTHVRVLIFCGTIHVGLLQRVCLQLDVYGVEKTADGEQPTDVE